MQNKLRIIGGEWRSRVVAFEDVPGLRPTPIRVRETLFNWVQQEIMGSRCLDLFSGSGALGFEAASRGAKSVTLVENNPVACHQLQSNIALLKAAQIELKRLDVMQFLAGEPEAFDLVFLDPPFAQNCAEKVCNLLEATAWLKPYAKIYVEVAAAHVLKDLPGNWRLLRHKTAGEVGYHLLERTPVSI